MEQVVLCCLALALAELPPEPAPEPQSPAESPAESASALEADEEGALSLLERELSLLYVRAAPSVVLVVSGTASGSGFAVGGGGLVVTSAHVVGEERQVRVQTLDGRSATGTVVAKAPSPLDVALVETPFDDLPPLEPAPEAEARAGSFAATIGHGGGAGWSFSTGLVANPRPLGDGAPLVLAQLALRPGSSGGPLLDRQGRVLGVVAAGTRDASGVTYAVRIDAVRAALPRLEGWTFARREAGKPAAKAAVAEGAPPASESTAPVTTPLEGALDVRQMAGEPAAAKAVVAPESGKPAVGRRVVRVDRKAPVVERAHPVAVVAAPVASAHVEPVFRPAHGRRVPGSAERGHLEVAVVMAWIGLLAATAERWSA
jgi:S1-C subfamily serine protease